MQNVKFRSVNDYRNAIVSLDESTNNTENQIKAIQKSLDNISTKQDPTITLIHTEIQHNQISALIETLIQDIFNDHNIAAKKLGKNASSTVIKLEDLLRRDDYILTQLEHSIQPTDYQSDLDESRQIVLVNAFKHTLSEIIRIRLNRTYFETFNSVQSRRADGHDVNTEKHLKTTSANEADAVKADLRSLYGEIDDVAQLRVNHEHADRTAGIFTRLKDLQGCLSALRTQQALRQLKAMTARLEIAIAQCEALQSQRMMQQHSEMYFERMSNDRRGIRHKVFNNNRPVEDGPALAALRQYFSLNDNNTEVYRDGQIGATFAEYLSTVDERLNAQKRQKASFESGDILDGIEEPTNNSRLTDLEGFIAVVKAQIEGLSENE